MSWSNEHASTAVVIYIKVIKSRNRGNVVNNFVVQELNVYRQFRKLSLLLMALTPFKCAIYDLFPN